jgi:hypothetical protein
MNLLAWWGLVGLLVAASLLMVTLSWRLRLAALAVQYLCVAALLTQIVIWQVAVVRLIVGAGIVGILALTGRELTGAWPWARPAAPAAVAGPTPLMARLAALWKTQFSADFPFRVVAVAMALVAAASLAGQPNTFLPNLPPGLKMAGYLLCGLGLFSLGLNEEPLRAGLSLLTLLSGFELLYAAVEPSLAIVGLLAGVDFAVALAVSYLALAALSDRKEPLA